ncbi:MAG: ATPase, T2SS/T4P/T4SS family [Microbacteriaceae bacterium]|nr:ATPase, T2SS/T4P/T4SS family [Microbacteriaceae bacterium]
MSPTLHSALGALGAVVDSDVRDVCVDGNGVVWVRRSAGFDDSGIRLEPREARRIGVGLVELTGGRVDDAKPTGDSALAGNIRAHVVLPPISRGSALISLRFPRLVPLRESDFTVENNALWDSLGGHSILVAGATGSGKTTVTEMLLARVPPNERVVVIEDIPELSVRHPHAVSMTTRPPNAEGAGTVSMSELVREALRMSPDRIVVGEVRGEEIIDLLLALTSGHRGLSTIHARSLDEVPDRLIALGMMAGVDPTTIARLVAVAFSHVVLCERNDDGHRLRLGRFRRTGDDVVVEW